MTVRSKRNGLLVLFISSFLVIFYNPLKNLLLSSYSNPQYSHLMFIPIISAYLIYTNRKTIFADTVFSIHGVILILISLLFLIAGINRKEILGQNDYLFLTALSIVIWWIGGFILIYGFRAYRKASFPLFFLVFMIPPPGIVLDNIILLLQSASAEVSYFFFKVTGVPVYREGFIFNLPGIDIEIAKQCSGIRSSTALMVLGVLLGHMFLKTWRGKTILILSVFPITVIKNGLRIVILSLLAVYVDKSILGSVAHSRGGYPFFLLGMAGLGAVIWILKKFEKRGLNKQTFHGGPNVTPS